MILFWIERQKIKRMMLHENNGFVDKKVDFDANPFLFFQSGRVVLLYIVDAFSCSRVHSFFL